MILRYPGYFSRAKLVKVPRTTSPKLTEYALHQTANHFRSSVVKLPGNVMITSVSPMYSPKTSEEEDPG